MTEHGKGDAMTQRPPTPADIEAELENTSTAIHVSSGESATGDQADRTAEQVRQGHTGDHLRYILRYSMLGLVVVFVIAYYVSFVWFR